MCVQLDVCLALRSLEALESYMRCGGGFVRSGDVFALAEVVRGLARCGRRSEVRPPCLANPKKTPSVIGKEGVNIANCPICARRRSFRPPWALPLEQVANYRRHVWTRDTIGVIVYLFLAEMFLTDGTPQLSNELPSSGIPHVQQYFSLRRRQWDCRDRRKPICVFQAGFSG